METDLTGNWLMFCVQGCEHVELIPGGSEVAVNLSNVHDYVRKYAEYRMVKAVHKPLEVRWMSRHLLAASTL